MAASHPFRTRRGMDGAPIHFQLQSSRRESENPRYSRSGNRRYTNVSVLVVATVQGWRSVIAITRTVAGLGA